MYIVTAQDPLFNILLYGPPGIGKTWLAATAQNHPRMGDVEFLNVEGGLATIASRGDIRAMNVIGIDRTESKLPENCTTLENEFWRLANRDAGYENINTVVIDSGTEIQTLNIEGVVAASISKNKAKYKDRDPDDIYVEDYGKSTAQLKRLFRWYRDLPINVIITALDQTVFPKGPDGKVKQNADPIMVRPWFTEKLAKATMGYMDMVWYMFQSEGDRYLMTCKTGIFEGKTRGVKFADTLGPKVLVRDATKPDHKGHDIASLYDLWLASEGQ